MRLVVGVATAGLLLAAGCRFTADYTGTHYRCGAGDSCPAGFACVAGYCEPGSVDGDGGRPDALTDAATDGGDATPAEDGAADAAGDAAGQDATQPDGQQDAAQQDATQQDAQQDAVQQDAQQDAGVTACGKTAALADDFNDGTLSYLWSNKFGGAATHAETGGELVITLAANAGNAYAGYQSLAFYDLAESQVSVEVTQMVNTATTAQAYLEVAYDNNHTFSITQESGKLSARQKSTALASDTYDGGSHRHWRIREAAGTVYFETSPNGTSWNVLHSLASPTWLGYVMVTLGGGTYENVSTPGAVHFDNLNGGTATGGMCPVSDLTDDFADSTTDILWENWYTQGGASLAETGGSAKFTPAATGESEAAYVSAKLYDLRGRSVWVEVPAVTANAAGAFTWMSVDQGWDDGIQMVYEAGMLYFRTKLSGSYNAVGSLAYDSSAHRWWQISEQGGSTYWWTSPNGVNWTKRASLSNPLQLGAVQVAIGAGTWQTVAAPGTASFDNVNRTP